jgi:hypothetical protein
MLLVLWLKKKMTYPISLKIDYPTFQKLRCCRRRLVLSLEVHLDVFRGKGIQDVRGKSRFGRLVAHNHNPAVPDRSDVDPGNQGRYPCFLARGR